MQKKLFSAALIFLSLFVFSSYAEDRDSLDAVKEKILSAAEVITKLKESQSVLEEKLSPLKEKKLSLENQLKILEIQNEETTKKINAVELLVNKKRMEIAQNAELLEKAEIEIGEEKDLVLGFIKEIYLMEKNFFSADRKSIDLIKILLSDKTIAEIVDEMRNLKIMEELGEKIFAKLDSAQKLFLEKEKSLEEKKNLLTKLKNILNQEKVNLIAQRDGREKLLAQTKGEEVIFQKLLQESKRQEENSLSAVAALQLHKSEIEKKLNIFDSQQTESREDLIAKMYQDSSDYDLDSLIADRVYDSPLVWPVSPERGLSAYFLDKSYEEYFKTKHYAIDIRASQGTPLRAPASAYVEKVADNGLGYSYIILAHKDGLSTLFGHVSKISVKEGELIQIGQVIGESGGTPGTQGAGLMTTGPHLHFEVHKDGKRVNPLDYLPEV